MKRTFPGTGVKEARLQHCGSWWLALGSWPLVYRRYVMPSPRAARILQSRVISRSRPCRSPITNNCPPATMASASHAIQLDLLADLQPVRAGDAGPGSGTVSSPEACGGGARVHQLDAGLDCVRGLLRRAYLPLRAHSGGAR